MSLSLFRALDNPWVGMPPVDAEFGSTTSMMPFSLGACDVRETDKAINIVMDVPGLTSDDVKVQLSGRKLTVSGKVSGCLQRERF